MRRSSYVWSVVIASAWLSVMPSVSAQSPINDVKTPKEVEKALEYFNSNSIKECLTELQSAYKAKPDLRPPHLWLADWYRATNRGSDARLHLEIAAKEDPQHPEVYLTNASYAFAEGQVTSAILNLQAAVQLAEGNRWTNEKRAEFTRAAYQGLAACYERRGDWVSVTQNLLALLRVDDSNGPLRVRLANALFQQGKTEEANKELQTARKNDPAVDLPELAMANLWNNANEPAKAEDQYKKAISLYPENAKAYRSYAGWLLDRGRIADVKIYLEQALKLDSTSREVKALHGMYLRYTKNFVEASKIFEELHRESPSDSFALGNLCIALAETEDEANTRRAVELADVFVKQNSKLTEPVIVLGWCLYKAKRIDDAERTLTSLSGNVSLDGGYFLAKILTEKKRYSQAEEVLTKILANSGPFVYRNDATALLETVKPLVPPVKKDAP